MQRKIDIVFGLIGGLVLLLLPLENILIRYNPASLLIKLLIRVIYEWLPLFGFIIIIFFSVVLIIDGFKSISKSNKK
ncbi:putative membrane protein [Anaerosolibacter carboniphilus]|uniref:Putative membrane protein n=1 Tax=Anaerosolibacter carboniphilus TaxID=1417629 RepID=A0A841KT12_9FIRM|nr:hypothetical protein [Anaerosolibacter carboniphilus]MBB6216854.1 putative membrane protein [Anaerosolibacter carboniphilus]